MLSEEKVQSRIDELKTQREELIKDANLQVAAINGAIAALESVLVPAEETDESE
jgi:hypothetical protein